MRALLLPVGGQGQLVCHVQTGWRAKAQNRGVLTQSPVFAAGKCWSPYAAVENNINLMFGDFPPCWSS